LKALTYLYPDEDARLMAADAAMVALAMRVFSGVLTRESMTEGEALAPKRKDLALGRGAITLDGRGLRRRRDVAGSETPTKTLCPGAELNRRHADFQRAASVSCDDTCAPMAENPGEVSTTGHQNGSHPISRDGRDVASATLPAGSRLPVRDAIIAAVRAARDAGDAVTVEVLAALLEAHNRRMP
jgi:hypothetical protein